MVALDIEKDSDNSRAGQRIHIVCLIFENEEGRNKTGFYYSVCVFSRICERVSCEESAIFFLQILHIWPTLDKITQPIYISKSNEVRISAYIFQVKNNEYILGAVIGSLGLIFFSFFLTYNFLPLFIIILMFGKKSCLLVI